jgi:hypothetical protein
MSMITRKVMYTCEGEVVEALAETDEYQATYAAFHLVNKCPRDNTHGHILPPMVYGAINYRTTSLPDHTIKILD